MVTTKVQHHNGKATKANGTFPANHNSRKGIQHNDGHIDPDGKIWLYSIDENGNWKKQQKGFSFESHEMKFYEENFTDWLNAKNEPHQKSRHYERIKTIEQIYKDKQYCPEETLLQLGKVDDDGNKVQAPKQLLFDATKRFLQQLQERYPNYKLLDIAFHDDEPGACFHCHYRGVFVTTNYQDSRNKNICGKTAPAQTQALKEMGFESPNTRYDNAKRDFDIIRREMFIECVKEVIKEKGYQVDLNLIVETPSKKTLDKDAFIHKKLTRLAKKLQKEISTLEKKTNELEQKNMTSKHDLEQRERDFLQVSENLKAIEAKLSKRQEDLQQTEDLAKQAEQLNQQVRDLQGYLNQLAYQHSILDNKQKPTAKKAPEVEYNKTLKDGIVKVELDELQQLYKFATQQADEAAKYKALAQDTRQFDLMLQKQTDYANRAVQAYNALQLENDKLRKQNKQYKHNHDLLERLPDDIKQQVIAIDKELHTKNDRSHSAKGIGDD